VSVEALVVPEVKHDLILGFDFWKAVGLVLDIPHRILSFVSGDRRVTVPAVFLWENSNSAVQVHSLTSEVRTLEESAASRSDQSTVGPTREALPTLTPGRNPEDSSMTTDSTISAENPRPDWKIRHSQLSEEEVVRLLEVLDKAYDVAVKGLGRTPLMTTKLKLRDPTPIRARQYPLSFAAWDSINKIVDKLLESKVIRPSFSEWRSPVLLIKNTPPKEDRMVLDFRALNAVLEGDAYPSNLIDPTFARLGRMSYISKFDLKAAFHQIPVDPESSHLLAFGIPGRGLFEWVTTPFGLKVAPAVMQRLMNKLFGLQYEPYIFSYLDDLILVTETFEHHLELIQVIFDKFREANLALNFEKIQICVEETEFLGFKISREGISLIPDRIEPLLNYPVPSTKKRVRSFVGACSYYRKHIPKFAEYTSPLNKLAAPKAVWDWTDECQKSFEALKSCLTSAPILSTPTKTGRYVLEVDASNRALGAVLKQVQGEDLKVIAYASRSLAENELKFSVTEKECLAILWAIDQKFRIFLEHTEFTVITDHYALKWLNSLKDPTGRLARWALRLQQYSFTIEHRKGVLNVTADLLSRIDCDVLDICSLDVTSLNTPADLFAYADCEAVEIIGPSGTAEEKWYDTQLRLVHERPEEYDLMRAYGIHLYRFVGALTEDAKWVPVLRSEERGRWTEGRTKPPVVGAIVIEEPSSDPWYEDLRQKVEDDPASYPLFKVAAGKLLRSMGIINGEQCFVPVVPKNERAELIRSCHDPPTAGHGGVFKTFKRVQREGYWPRMLSDVKNFVQKCLVCGATKPSHQKPAGEMYSHQADRPWQTLSVDLMGPYPRTANRNRYVLVTTDIFSKWTHIIPVGDATAKTICKKFEKEVILNYGACGSCISDNGTQFKSKEFIGLLEKYGIHHILTPLYHAQANPVERVNQSVKKMIRAYVNVNHKTWDKHLPELQYALRSAVHESTGFSPARLMLNRELTLKGSQADGGDVRVTQIPRAAYGAAEAERNSEMDRLIDEVRASLLATNMKNKAHYDLRRRITRLVPGQLVWRINKVQSDAAEGFAASLAPHYIGPFQVAVSGKSGVYSLKKITGEPAGEWHINDLLAYPPDQNASVQN